MSKIRGCRVTNRAPVNAPFRPSWASKNNLNKFLRAARLHRLIWCMNPAQNVDAGRAYQQQAYAGGYEQPQRPARADVITAENRFTQQTAQQNTQQGVTAQQKEFSQVADKLATMFAEAYQLISQFKSNLDAQPQTQPQAQPVRPAIRPDVVNADVFYPRR